MKNSFKRVVRFKKIALCFIQYYAYKNKDFKTILTCISPKPLSLIFYFPRIK